MNESTDSENKKHARQKPPLSVGRIVGEIMVGEATAATAAAIVYSFFYVVGQMTKDPDVIEGSMCSITLWDLVIWGIMIWVVPATYVLGTTVGVHFVGSRGNLTGSFLATLGFGLIGGFVTLVTLIPVVFLSAALIVGVENIVRWALWVLVSFIPPIGATLGFNLTRRYKKPPSS